MRILISQCLLGSPCRYDGGAKGPAPWVAHLMQTHELVPVCPEQLGGLPTPRPSAERCGERVKTAAGVDVTAQYRRGAAEALRLAELYGCQLAILKARSPACGSGEIYDGTFTHTRTAGWGVAAAALREAGIPVIDEQEAAHLTAGGGVLPARRMP